MKSLLLSLLLLFHVNLISQENNNGPAPTVESGYILVKEFGVTPVFASPTPVRNLYEGLRNTVLPVEERQYRYDPIMLGKCAPEDIAVVLNPIPFGDGYSINIAIRIDSATARANASRMLQNQFNNKVTPRNIAVRKITKLELKLPDGLAQSIFKPRLAQAHFSGVDLQNDDIAVTLIVDSVSGTTEEKSIKLNTLKQLF